jgi:hypothetical protein
LADAPAPSSRASHKGTNQPSRKKRHPAPQSPHPSDGQATEAELLQEIAAVMFDDWNDCVFPGMAPIHPATASEHRTEAEVIAAWQAEIARVAEIVGERALAVELFRAFGHERGREVLEKAARSKNPSKYVATAVRNRRTSRERERRRTSLLAQHLGAKGAAEERAEYWPVFAAVGINSLFPKDRGPGDDPGERAAKRLAEFGTEDEEECLRAWLNRTTAEKEATFKRYPEAAAARRETRD